MKQNCRIPMAFLVLGIFLIFSFGCISGEWKTVVTPANTSIGVVTPKPASIQASISQDWYTEDRFNVEFKVYDKSYITMPAAGTLKLEIIDDDGVTLYNTTKYLSESDFNSTSSSYSWATSKTYSYEFDILYSSITKSNSDEYYATANVYFTPSSSTKELEYTYKYVSLPNKLKNASTGWGNVKTINASQSKGNAKVTLTKTGYYKSSSYYSSKYWTAEIKIENTGSNKLSAYLKDVVIVTGGKQYTATISPWSSASSPDVLYPGTILTKNLQFYDDYDDTLNSTTQKTLYMELTTTYDTSMDKQTFAFSFN